MTLDPSVEQRGQATATAPAGAVAVEDAPPAWAPPEQPWHPGYPFRPRLSKFRRVGMATLLVLLCGVIGGYWYLTDSARVRALAESYLADVLGGPVRIRHAKLSIFEGLQLDGVEVRVDDSDRPDSTIFSAERFDLTYDFRSLVAGDLSATVIRAIDPHVWLTEDVDSGTWNFQRMVPRATSRPEERTGRRRDMVLPEIVLRNAHVDYSQMKAGAWSRVGSFAIEGTLRPGADRGDYVYAVQSRGQTEEMGPTLSGDISMGTGHVTAHLRDFTFGRDVRAMLPAQVREWWERHKFAGQITTLDLDYWLPAAGGDKRPERFDVVAAVEGVTITLHPEEWRTREQNARLAFVRRFDRSMRWLDAFRPRPGTDVLSVLSDAVTDVPVEVDHVAGTFAFTRDKIEVRRLTGRVETTALVIDGWMSGYADPDRDPTFEISVNSGRLENLVIPKSPRWLKALPRPLRNIYDMFKPEGTAAVAVTVGKESPDADVYYSGKVEIIDGRFVFERFPYPAREGRGVIEFTHDHRTGKDELTMNVSGRGIAGGVNEDTRFSIVGRLAPLSPEMLAHIEISGQDVSNEPALRAAFPANVRKALTFFDADKTGVYPTFHGKFHTDVERVPTVDRHGQPDHDWVVNLDIDVDHAAGKPVAFPYPLKDVAGKLHIREGYVDIEQFGMTKGDASLAVTGRVSWKGSDDEEDDDDDDDHPYDHNKVHDVALHQDIKVAARRVPIDEDLLKALPGGKRAWIDRLGITGKLDVDGRVFTPERAKHAHAHAAAAATAATATATAAAAAARPTTGPVVGPSAGDDDDVTYDLNLHLADGALHPPGTPFEIAGLAGDLRVTPTALAIERLAGRRLGGGVRASGLIEWPNDEPQAALHVDATALPLDAGLYAVVPAAVRESWDAIHPVGTTDVKLDLRLGYDEPPTAVVTSSHAVAAAATTRPTGAPDVHLVLNPRDLSITTKVVPYRLDQVHGTIDVVDDRVSIPSLTAAHGATTRVRLSGNGTLSRNSTWDLALATTDLAVDDDFRKALPASLAGLVTSMELGGVVDLDFPKLVYRANPAPASSAAAAAGATTKAAAAAVEDNPDVDFTAKVRLKNAKVTAGVPMSGMLGTLDFAGSVRNGSVADLTGSANIPTLVMAARPARDFRLTMRKPADRPALSVETLQAQVAGGELAGQVNLVFPDNGPARYALTMVLRNADVEQLTGRFEERITGTANASLNLEGAWDDNASRRGRGDVTVTGQNMVRIPLLMGLLQVTNLSLPSNAPFQEGESRYSVEGNRVTFESIVLRARDNLLKGSGWLDFASKKVHLTFVTENPTLNQIPLVGDIVNPLKQELLQFQVRGTLQEPKMSAASFNTITTTVDEVFRSEPKATSSKPGKRK